MRIGCAVEDTVAKHIKHNEWDTETVEKTQSEAQSINWHQQTQAHTGLQRHTQTKAESNINSRQTQSCWNGTLSQSVPWLWPKTHHTITDWAATAPFKNTFLRRRL